MEEENVKSKKVKEALLCAAVIFAVIGCLAGIGVGSYKYFYDVNKTTVQTLSQNEETEKNDKDKDIDENTEEDELKIDEFEEEPNEEQEEQKEQEEKKEMSAEEKKKQEEERKKREEEQRKKKEEEQKRTAEGYPYWIKVNYTANTVTIYKKDESGNFTIPVKAMVCSTGKATPRSGVYKTPQKAVWGNLIGSYGQYCTRITGQILFHSVPYLKKYDKTSLEYWEYDRLGQTRSMGCIRLTVIDAKWIFDNCPIGTPVEFYGSSDPGPLGKPTAQKISGYPEPYRLWDPTDPDPNNPWKTKNAQQEQKTVVEKVKVPNVIGQTEESAKTLLTSNGLKCSVEYKTELTGTEGVVISQSKDANSEVDKQTEVKITVRKLEPKVTVPNVVGKSLADAKKELNEKNLKYKVVEVTETSGKDGIVISQSIAQGTQVVKQTEITIKVRKLDDTIEVPNVIGKTESKAKETLKNKGFEVKVNYISNANKTNGVVTTQNPVSGTKAKKQSIVEITVNKINTTNN